MDEDPTIFPWIRTVSTGKIPNPDLAKKPDPGLCMANEERFLKDFKKNILDILNTLLFCFHTFSVRRTIDVLASENQPGSGSVQIRPGFGFEGSRAYRGRLTTKVLKQKRRPL